MCENTDSRCTTTVAVRGTRLRASGLSRFLCLAFFAAAKKVSAAPHRGDANKSLRKQGKAHTAGTQKPSAPQAKKPLKAQHRRQTPNRPASKKSHFHHLFGTPSLHSP